MRIDYLNPRFHATPGRSLPLNLLRAWADVCADYQRIVGDLPWYYHERAQIGFLAAAAWRLGGVALEEWRTDKISHDGPSRNGRGDLWVQLKSGAWHIEAKHVTVRLRGTPARR